MLYTAKQLTIKITTAREALHEVDVDVLFLVFILEMVKSVSLSLGTQIAHMSQVAVTSRGDIHITQLV